MDDALRVRVVHRIADLRRTARASLGASGFFARIERRAVDPLHHDVRLAFDLAAREHARDARVIELQHDAELRREAHERFVRHLVQHLDRDLARRLDLAAA